MMRLALAEWVKFVDISQLSVALHCNSLPRFIDTHIFIYFEYVNSDRKRIGQKYTKDFKNKKFRKQFHFLTCILPDYVFHESLKEFW